MWLIRLSEKPDKITRMWTENGDGEVMFSHEINVEAPPNWSLREGCCITCRTSSICIKRFSSICGSWTILGLS